MKRTLLKLCYVTLFLSLLLAPASLSALAAEGEYKIVDEGGTDASAITLNVNETKDLKVSPEPTGQTVTWSSVPASVATVDEHGVVKGVGKGTATITATIPITGSGATSSSSTTATCTVTVEDPDAPPAVVLVDGVTLDETSITINKDETKTLTATVTPTDATDKSVTWSSDATSVATVDEHGTVKGVAKGTATITATTNAKDAEDKALTATCAVTVEVPVEKVTLNKSETTLTINGKETLSATVTPDDADDADKIVTWSTSDENVATVNTSTGEVTGVAIGTATITATAGGKSDTCKVTVPGVKLSADDTPINSLTLNIGDTKELKATVAPHDAEVEWKVEGTGVSISPHSAKRTATIKGTGTEDGEATITVTATAGGKTYKATCTVTVKKVLVSGVTLDRETATLDVGKPLTLKAAVAPKEATNQNVTWSTSDEKIAAVKDGKVTGVAKGEATITVSTEEKKSDGTPWTATCKVTVQEVSAAGVTISPDRTITLEPKGDTSQRTHYLTANISPADTTNTAVSWQLSAAGSDTPSIDTASSTAADHSITNGIVRLVPDSAKPGATLEAVAPGTCRVMVKTKDGDLKSNPITIVVSGVILPAAGVDAKINVNQPVSPTFYGAAANFTVSEWQWRVEDRTIARVSSGGIVTGVAEGTTKVTCSAGSYSATCDVRVGRRSAAAIRHEMSGRRMNFTEILDDLEDIAPGDNSYLTGFSVDAAQGTLYSNFIGEPDTGHGVSSADKYYFNGDAAYNQVRDISFIPKEDFSGEAVIRYTACPAGGAPTAGEIVVTVDPPSAITYTSEHGEAVHFRGEDFSRYSEFNTGRPISSVTFTAPASKYGFLYYNYSSGAVYESNISAGTKYYRTSNPSIDSVSFVPASGYQGTFTISYRGSDSAGYSFTGTVRVTVGSSGDTGDGLLSYRVSPGKSVYLRPADFSDACWDATDDTLDYIRFDTLPSSDDGTLYCDGDRVTTSTRYYRNGSTRPIRELYFASKSGMAGTVSIPFTGISDEGDSFNGTVRISASDSGADGDIYYTVRPGGRVHFSTADFTDVCWDIRGRQLDYVRFTSLPSSTRGVLYYDTDTKVTSGTSYYRTSRRELEDVSFLAKSNFTGSASIPFTGYDVNGGTFRGTVVINVSNSEAVTAPTPSIGTSGTRANYYTAGDTAYFRAADFTTACRDLLPSTLSKVRITPPPASVGKLYTRYASPSDNTPLRADQDCSVVDLNDICFIPKAGYSGTARLYYTATDAQGNVCGNSFTLQVSVPSTSYYFDDMANDSWASASVDFLRRTGITSGVSDRAYNPEAQMKRGDFVLMLSRAFNLPLPAPDAENFADVPQESYYSRAILSAKALGLISGEDGSFRPDAPITRQDAGVMLYRCLLREKRTTAGTATDLEGFPDRAHVAPYAVAALGALSRDGILAGDDAGNLTPGAILNRAQMAVILHRALT